MPVAITWNYTAANCPALPVYSTILNPADDTQATPVAYQITATSDGTAAQIVRPGLDANAKRLDSVGFYGGGALAILRGGALSVSATAQSVDLAETWAGIGSGVHVAPVTVALTAAVSNHLWVLANGTISVRTDLTLPAMPAVYLGRVTVNGSGVVTEIDYSGRLELKGGTLRRRTSDAGMPADTPPAEYLIFHRTAGGRYLWDGDVYYAL